MGTNKMVVTYKQELPPPGGFDPVQWAKRPVKGRFKPITIFGAFAVTHVLGWMAYFRFRQNRRENQLEMTDARVAVRPFQLAERDRAFLMQLRKNREEEDELMKDVPGWKTGTLWGVPVYYNKRNRYFEPSFNELTAHYSKKDKKDTVYYYWRPNKIGP